MQMSSIDYAERQKQIATARKEGICPLKIKKKRMASEEITKKKDIIIISCFVIFLKKINYCIYIVL